MSLQQNSKPPDWHTLRKVYDRRAEEYCPAADPGRRVLSRKHLGIIAHLRFSPQSLILDAGCGDGVYCEWLSGEGENFVVGVDISGRILSIARRNIASRGNLARVPLVASNVEQLPFAKDTFDGALCTQVIEHLLDDRAGLHELYRVLRPGGQLVISTDNHDNLVTSCLALPVRVVRALLGRPDWQPPFPHRDYQLPVFAALVTEMGFKIELTQTYRFSLPRSLSRLRFLTLMLDLIEMWLIRLPGLRNCGDIIVVIARKSLGAAIPSNHVRS